MRGRGITLTHHDWRPSMDAGNFDAWTKRLTDTWSRRGLLGGMLGFLALVLGVQKGETKRTRPRTNDRKQTGSRKRQARISAKKCRAVGHPCNEKQTCCPGLGCDVIGPGAVRRCTPCAAEGAACTGDEACCGEGCCRDELIDPVGTCCGRRDRCCGRDCCTEGEACDQRFLMCVPCTPEGACQNPVPFCVCCPGLDLICDGGLCRCVP
jgi:hypothetical protein